jgi:hypothetical protein
VHRGFGNAVVSLLVVLSVLGAVIAFPRWYGESRARASDLNQAQLYEWGTTGSDIEFEDVRQRLVIVPPVEDNSREITMSYLARLFGTPATCSVVGTFDPRTGHIEIVGRPERFEARLPGKYKPNFYRTLRHEYGHAAFFQWAHANGIYPSSPRFVPLGDEAAEPNPKDYPPKLQRVVREWSEQPEKLYGHPYLTSTFIEYIAESYAQLLDGNKVPPSTRRFLVEAYGGRSRSD